MTSTIASTTLKLRSDVDSKKSTDTRVMKLSCDETKSEEFNYNKTRFTYFIYRVSMGSLVPFITLYMQHKGLNHTEIGSLQAIKSIVQLIFAPIWGSLSDHPGKKKQALLCLYAGSVIFRLCIAFVGSSRVGFAACIFTSYMFYAAVPSILDSIVVSSMPESDRANFGRVRLFGELGSGVTSSIMMSVINNENYGFEYMFIVHAIASLVAFLCLVSFVRVPASITNQVVQKDKAIKSNWKDGIRLILGDIQILVLFSLIIFMGYTLGFADNFCYMNMRQIFEKNEEPIGQFFTICRMCLCIGGIVSWFFAGSLTKRFGSELVMFAALFCMPICLFLYGGISQELNFWTKCGFLLAESIRSGVYAILWSTATVRLNKLCPTNMKSTMQSLMDCTYKGFGHTSGAFVGGILCKRHGTMSEAFMVMSRGLLSFLITIGAVLYTLPPK